MLGYAHDAWRNNNHTSVWRKPLASSWAGAGDGAMITDADTDITLPSDRGAYGLLIDSESAVAVRIGRRGRVLAPGLYLYCGSANGPGGIAGRVGRHLRREKALRWHVDRLTRAGRIAAVIVAPGGDECGLFSRFSAVSGAEVPIAGFGASDCRRCPAHLVRFANSSQPFALPLTRREFMV